MKKFGKLILFLFLFSLTYFFGFLHGHQNLKFEKSFVPQIINRELKKPAQVDFSLFWEAYAKLSENFLGQIDPQEIIYGAISGMVRSLNDPYTVFMKPGESKLFKEDLSGAIEGIGAEIALKGGKYIIVAPLPSSPAEKAGLRSGDEILKIDDEDSFNLEFDEVIAKIRGPKGSSVTLTIQREGFDKPKEFSIKRAKIKIESVKWEMKDNNLGYIQISSFAADTLDLFKKATDEILSKSPQGIILDLRNNPGGFLETAVDVTSYFIPEGVAVIEEDKGGERHPFKTTQSQRYANVKVVVLINEGSASASEILAGAISDIKIGTLVGKKTFGKGTVQTIEDLSGGSALRITTAKWLTPKGREINGQGINPDIEVDKTEQDEAQNRDPQLEKALEILK